MKMGILIYQADYHPLDQGGPERSAQLTAWARAYDDGKEGTARALASVIVAAMRYTVLPENHVGEPEAGAITRDIDAIMDVVPPNVIAHVDALTSCAS